MTQKSDEIAVDAGGDADASDRAVVIGAGIAGLMAARVLVEHFEDVLIIERDSLDGESESRSGIPQDRHVHGYLRPGIENLESLFDGIWDEVAEHGGTSFDFGQKYRHIFPQGIPKPVETELQSVGCGRVVLEPVLRSRVRELEGVRIVDRTEVTDLVVGEDGKGVEGVEIRARGRELGETEQLTSALVVDAAGRSSDTVEFLDRHGFGEPEIETVDPKLGYATVWVTDLDVERDWEFMFVHADPPEVTRGGVIGPVDGDRWTLSLFGYQEDYPPTEFEDLKRWCEGHADPSILHCLEHSEQLSKIYSFRGTANFWAKYESVDQWPAGYLVVGDATSTTNPTFGHGVTVASRHAMALDEHLERHGGTLSGAAGRAFQARVSSINEFPWTIATTEDHRWSDTEGVSAGASTRWMQAYLDWVKAASTSSEAVARRFFRVINLVDGPASLFSPVVLTGALYHGLLGSRSGAN